MARERASTARGLRRVRGRWNSAVVVSAAPIVRAASILVAENRQRQADDRAPFAFGTHAQFAAVVGNNSSRGFESGGTASVRTEHAVQILECGTRCARTIVRDLDDHAALRAPSLDSHATGDRHRIE